ncbi:hypothetical protein CHARACLAT_005614 [Characodon lateralis]|uniref:Uncharacterized protein n=1 Tax=Characodon lateralis TaxID=208331 RepID=A0ABU7DNQ1_9TELE|nr:hypothetical protein [Characodon lateralis]
MLAVTSPYSQLRALHNLKLNCSTEGRSSPDHAGASFTVGCRRHLQLNLFFMSVMLEAIRTIQMHFYVIRLKFSSIFQFPMFGALLHSPKVHVCGVGGDIIFKNIFLSISLFLTDAVLWLLGTSQHR